MHPSTIPSEFSTELIRRHTQTVASLGLIGYEFSDARVAAAALIIRYIQNHESQSRRTIATHDAIKL